MSNKPEENAEIAELVFGKHDVLDNLDVLRINCLDHGFVQMVDVMPRLLPVGFFTADYAVAEAARVSYDNRGKSADRDLIRYLYRSRHTTPFEMVEFKFHCRMPIFVARQWIRHRTANVNELSGRYSVLPGNFYIPEKGEVRAQSKTNKQGGEEPIGELTASQFVARLDEECKKDYEEYVKDVDSGISKELARMQLPLNLYTEWFWKIDLHNLLHFLALRCDTHAQKEIRVFSDAMLELITPIVPVAVEAWNDYHPYRGAITLTRLEVEALQQRNENGIPMIKSDNKREKEEWIAKATKLGLGFRPEGA